MDTDISERLLDPRSQISEQRESIDDDSEEERIPNWRDQITVRALSVSAVLGSLFCIITHKLSLTVGMIPSLNIASGLLGFFFVKSWTGFLSRLGLSVLPFTRQENTVIQTCVVACYGLPLGGGGSYLIAMDEKLYQRIGADYPGNRAEDVKNLGLGWMIAFSFECTYLICYDHGL